MKPIDWILIAVGIALLLLLLWLLLRRLKKRRGGAGQTGSGGGGGEGQGVGQAEGMSDAERQAAVQRAAAEAEARAQAAAVKVQEVLRSDPRLAQRLLQRAGQAHGPLQDVSASAEDALRIARKLPSELIDAFWLAASQKEIVFDLKRESERTPSNFPTGDIEPVPMSGFDQLASVMPEQLVMPDEQFYPALAGQELTVLQSYERKNARKRLYILLDVSGSMGDGTMADGRKRHVWARGVTVNLLLEATAGDAEYYLRPFDGEAHDLRQALTPDEAEKLIDYILDRGFSGSGTNIKGALATACRDIRARKSADIDRSEVLLITDGEDQSMDDAASVRKLLGEDIRLHVVQIGNETDALKRVASSYRSFR